MNKRKQQKAVSVDLKSTQPLIDDAFMDDVGVERADPLPDADNRRWELDENPIIEAIVHALRREFRTAQGKWRTYGKPIVNQKGLSDIESLCLRPYLTKYVALTTLNESEINNIVVQVVKALMWLIAEKYVEWDFDKAYRNSLVAMVETQVKTQLNRAKNGATLNYRADSFGYDERYNHNEVHPSEIGGGFSPSRQDDVSRI